MTTILMDGRKSWSKAIEALTRPSLEKKLVTVENVIEELANIGFATDEKFQYYDKYVNLQTAYGDKIAALKALGNHAGAWKDPIIDLGGKIEFTIHKD